MNELVFNQPIETGTIRAEFFGDTEKAKGYITAGRKILGAVRTFNGVNQRIAEGAAGGFYRHLAQLEDGTQIEVLTNNGMDTVRIYAVPAPEPVNPVSQPETEKPIKEDVIEPITLGNYRPYIWIGVRYISGGIQVDESTPNFYYLNVWEPGNHDILSNSIVSLRNNTDSQEGNADYPLGDNNIDPANGDKPTIRYNDNHLIIYENYTDDAGVEWNQVVVGDDDDTNPQMYGHSTDLVAGDYLASVSMWNDDYCNAAADEPMILELKVIMGKDENRTEFTQKLTIERGSYYEMNTYPYGYFGGEKFEDVCPTGPADNGENPHGVNWAQDIVVASLPPLQADEPLNKLFTGAVTTTTELPDGFGSGVVPTSAEICPIIIYTYYVSVVEGYAPTVCGGGHDTGMWALNDGIYHGDYYKYQVGDPAQVGAYNIQTISMDEFSVFRISGNDQTAGTHGSGCALFTYEC
jgi:hypothetical protein